MAAADSTMTRAATSRSDLLRHGFVDSDRTLAGMAQLGDHAEPLVALLGRTADPDLALTGLLRLAEAVDDSDALLDAAGRRRGHGDAAAVRAGRQPGAGRPPGPSPRPLARPHRPDHGQHPAGGVRRPGRPARRRRRRPARRRSPVASLPEQPGPRRAARRVPPGAGPAGRARPGPPRRRRRRGRRALRPGGRHPRGRAGGRAREGRGGRRIASGWPSSRWASAAATSSTTSPTST